MATTPRSPRAKTEAEKAAYNAHYKLDAKGITNFTKEMSARFNALVELGIALGQAGKGSYLAFPNPHQPGTFIPFNRRHHKSACAKFVFALKELKKYFTAAKKKDRAKARPESFTGTYTPVFAADALVAYFNNEGGVGFGYVDPRNANSGLLMDQLPMVKQGYLLRNTVTLLFYIYAHARALQKAENAQFAQSDDLMNQVFGGTIPAAYYSWKVNTGKTKVKKVKALDGTVSEITVPALDGRKMPMDDAVAQGAIAAPLNTYDVIRVSYPDFNPAEFNTYFYQNIAAANYYSRTALAANPRFAQVAEALARDDIRQAMLAEHNLIHGVSALWHEILEPDRKITRDNRKRVKDAEKKALRAAQGL